MHRRTILVAAFSAAAILFPALSASAANVTEYVEEELQVAQGPDGSPQTQVIERVVTVTGQVLRTSTSMSENPRFSAKAESPYACAHDGYRSGFNQYKTEETLYRGKNDFVQFLFFPYSLDNARRMANGRWEKQWLVCATGGADANNGSRTVMSGPGIAYRDSGATYKIGQTWKEGRTPGTYSINLGFEVPTEFVTVKAGLTQTPTSSLKGSPRPPWNSDMDKLSRNGANGWWEADCAPDCVGTGGSSNFQGSVVEALFQFPQDKPVGVYDFAMKGFHKHFCSNPFGC